MDPPQPAGGLSRARRLGHFSPRKTSSMQHTCANFLRAFAPPGTCAACDHYRAFHPTCLGCAHAEEARRDNAPYHRDLRFVFDNAFAGDSVRDVLAKINAEIDRRKMRTQWIANRAVRHLILREALRRHYDNVRTYIAVQSGFTRTLSAEFTRFASVEKNPEFAEV